MREKIGLLIQSTAGFGGERVFNTIAREMARSGTVEPLVLTIDERWSSAAAGMNIEQLSLRRSGRGPVAFLAAAEDLRVVIKKRRLAAVISFMTYANLVGLLGVRLGGSRCRIVISEHTQTSILMAGVRRPLVMRAAVRALYRSADAILAVSKAVQADLVTQLALPARTISVVNNPVDVEAVLRGVEDAPATERADVVDRSSFRLVTLGSLNSAKGHAYAVEALALLPPRYQLHVVGDGPLRADLEDQVARLGLSDRVRFHGFLSNPYPLLAASDALVHPSLREGFGLAVVEAGVLGVPAIASSVGGLPELVPDPVPGRLVPPAEPASLAAAIEATVLLAPNRDSEVTRQRVRERFDPAEVSLRYENAALDRPSGRRPA